MSTVIQVKNLSKSYRLGQIGSRTLTEDLNRWWARVRKQPDPYLRIGQEHLADRIGERIWALKDINFEVQQGEVLGIIGRNGAGKSTLLKILSRVTAPTTGEVRVKGRIASLLEVGTGFHPELTGKENIFLNGAILGMKREEIERKFDEIVDFSGVEKFIDTPVKRYSSGMYVRLAFAVAAHLDPEILVVDEVLAVGDAEFQKKCLGKMSEVAGEGRTVLFVSHNMGAINKLCENAIFIDNGLIKNRGTAEKIVEAYLESSLKSNNFLNSFERPLDFSTWVNQISILANDIPSPVIKYGDTLTFEIQFSSKNVIQEPGVGLLISTIKGDPVLNSNNLFLPSFSFDPGVKNGVVRCELGKVPFLAGHYSVSFWFGETRKSKHQFLENVISFEVIEKDIWGFGKLPTQRISPLWWLTQFRPVDVPTIQENLE